MDVVLWISQILLALAFVAAGVNHAFRFEQIKSRMAWVTAVPRGLVTFIGICEILGGIGLVLPAVTNILPLADSAGGLAPGGHDGSGSPIPPHPS